MKNLYLKMIKPEYVRVFELQKKAIICEKAKGCDRGCPCQEEVKNSITVNLKNIKVER